VSASSIAVRAHRAASRIAVLLAVLGAAILMGAAAIVAYSVLLRVFANGQVLGDFEIMSVASGIAILLFFPYCQATRAHVLIEIFTSWLPASLLRVLEALWSVVLAAAAAFLTWRLFIGFDEALAQNNVTIILHLPLAAVFVAAMLGAAGTAVLALLDFVRAFAPANGDNR
jgi:TRAP-type C4-dicarboxylate transport system permease small subunit